MQTEFRFSLLLFIAAFALVAAASAGRNEPLVGGWETIKNLSDPYVKEIADFAVTEYNRQSKESLKLVGIKSGESQPVAGTNYRLIIDAADGISTELYEAVVWDKEWEHYRNLTSFKPVQG